MSNFHGDIRLGDTIDIKFTSRAFATGAPTTLSGSPAVAAYVGNGTTEITAGITLSVDFDSRAGLNNVRIVASSGNGYATATNVELVITAGTVGGTSVVGECVGSFSIENRSAVKPTVAGRTLDVTATGAAGIDWANIENQSTAVNLSATNIDPDQVVASVTGAVGSVTGSVGSVVGSVGSVTGAVGSVTGNVGGNVTGSVGSVVGNVGGNVTGSVGSVLADVSVGNMTAAALADFFLTNSGSNYAASVAGSVVKEIADNAGGSSLTAAGIADAVWDEALSGHLTAGSTGAALAAAGSAGDPWGTALPGAYGAGTAGNIVGNRLDVAVSSRMATYTQPTGFLAATFPSGTVASTTNITAGTITTVSGNVNGSVGSVTGSVGSVTGSVGSVTGSVGSVTGSVGSVVAPVTVGTNSDKTGYTLSAAGIDSIWDEVVEGAVTARQASRLWNSAMGGKASGLATTAAVYRDLGDTKNRISATVDADGNRSSVLLDLT